MHEDWTIEAAVFPPKARVFCIASAGCTALALASRGDDVTAVDINPAQVDYVRSRMAGSPRQSGAADRWLARGRRALRFLGMREEALRAFLLLEDPGEQIRVWRMRFDRGAWRMALAFALTPVVLRAIYSAPFVRALPAGFAAVMRRRLERGFATHPNRTNPYAWDLLLGCEPPEGDAPESDPSNRSLPSLTVACADAADALEASARASFNAFSLSNIFDGATPAFAQRLRAAVHRAAAPGAILVSRSFAEPKDPEEAAWAARDRAWLWGSVRVETIPGS
jgi:S-adenosylmethionine:diacylglycerol 3-amino-3-carboxypropyl transferase